MTLCQVTCSNSDVMSSLTYCRDGDSLFFGPRDISLSWAINYSPRLSTVQSLKQQFKCYVTLLFWKSDTHPPLVTLITWNRTYSKHFFSGYLTPSHPLLHYVTLEWPQITYASDAKKIIGTKSFNSNRTNANYNYFLTM